MTDALFALFYMSKFNKKLFTKKRVKMTTLKLHFTPKYGSTNPHLYARLVGREIGILVDRSSAWQLCEYKANSFDISEMIHHYSMLNQMTSGVAILGISNSPVPQVTDR